MSNYDFKKSEHLIKPKVERKLRRNKSEGKFLISGEYYNYVIS
jgi:hypothetical protein